jgi:hypothetical protein
LAEAVSGVGFDDGSTTVPRYFAVAVAQYTRDLCAWQLAGAL